MPSSSASSQRRPSPSLRPHRLALTVALCVVVAVCPAAAAHAASTAPATADGDSATLTHDWLWPVHPFRLVRAFAAPAHEYGPGHRGVDLLAAGGSIVRAPAAGVVAFSGQVAGRGLITVDHGDGLVTTLEPVDAVLTAGTPVAAQTPLGSVSAGGHTEADAVHFGVRLDGVYINPLVLLGEVPRAVLLPCC